MHTLVLKLEKEIAKIEKLYDAKIKKANASITNEKPYGDGILFESADKISEKKHKLKQALILVLEVYES